MNLVIDIGNTFAKCAVVADGEVVFAQAEPTLDPERVEVILRRYPAIDRAILSTTRHPDPALEAFLGRRVARFVRFEAGTTETPLQNRYATPRTLGADRLAAAVGAWGEAPGREILVVDFGSAITIDRVSAAGEYLGGNISPGLAMRFEALHRLTDRLPLCDVSAGDGEESAREFVLTGANTRQAIESGVVVGIVHEIEGYIARLEAQNPENEPLALFFAGRDANFFAEKVKKTIFVIHDLVVRGLNRILEYNAQFNHR